MFPYQDPTGSDSLKQQNALTTYQGKLQAQYVTAAAINGTQFVPIRSSSNLPPSGEPVRTIVFAPGAKFSTAIVPWNAFPRRNQAANNIEVDQRRGLQEEYAEWLAQSSGGKITTVTFTTEFAAYFQTFADISFEALVAGIKAVMPTANPTVRELFGMDQKPLPLTADGEVGPRTWDLIGRILDRPPSNPPNLRLGSRGESVVWLQTRLAWLGLFTGTLDGDFGPRTQAAVISAQKRYTGGGELFRQHLPNNPWNNGQKGILCMANGDNTLPLLFGLLAHCAIPRRDVPAQEICRLVGGNHCVTGRSSDPNVCMAAQTEVVNGNVLSLSDPTGVQIITLQGIWRINNSQIDINDPQKNQGAWQVSRNGHRAVLRNLPGLTLDGAPLTTGAQVARKLQVGVRVTIAASKDIKS